MSSNDVMRLKLEEWRRQKEAEKQKLLVTAPKGGPKTPQPLISTPKHSVVQPSLRLSVASSAAHQAAPTVQKVPTKQPVVQKVQKEIPKRPVETRSVAPRKSAVPEKRPSTSTASSRQSQGHVLARPVVQSKPQVQKAQAISEAKAVTPNTRALVKKLEETVKGKNGDENEEETIYALDESVIGSQTPTRGQMLPQIKSFIHSALIVAQRGQFDVASRLLESEIFVAFPGARLHLLASWWMARARIAELSGNFAAVLQIYEMARSQPGIAVSKLHEGLVRFSQRIQQLSSLNARPDLLPTPAPQTHQESHMSRLSSNLSRHLAIESEDQETSHSNSLNDFGAPEDATSSAAEFQDLTDAEEVIDLVEEDPEDEDEECQEEDREDEEDEDEEDEVHFQDLQDRQWIPDANEVLPIESNITSATPEKVRNSIIRGLSSPFLKNHRLSRIVVETVESVTEDLEYAEAEEAGTTDEEDDEHDDQHFSQFDQHDCDHGQDTEDEDEDSGFVETTSTTDFLRNTPGSVDNTPLRSCPITPSLRSVLSIEEPQQHFSHSNDFQDTHQEEEESAARQSVTQDHEQIAQYSSMQRRTKVSNSFLQQLINKKVDLDEVEKSMAVAISHRSPKGSMVLEQETSDGSSGVYKTPVRRSARVARRPNTNSKSTVKVFHEKPEPLFDEDNREEEDLITDTPSSLSARRSQRRAAASHADSEEGSLVTPRRSGRLMSQQRQTTAKTPKTETKRKIKVKTEMRDDGEDDEEDDDDENLITFSSARRAGRPSKTHN